jgi:RES domain
LARLPHPLASGALTLAHAPVGSVWHHIFLDRFPDPLGFGFASSRFSDPRRKPASRFGVYYVGHTFEVAFLETIVRDLRNGNPGPLILSANDLDDYVHVHVTVQARLDLVDLRGGNAVALGVPTNAVRASSHRLGQRASLAVYQRADRLDGIWYPSRLNGDENLAVYDRAVPKLAAGARRKLGTCPELAPIVSAYHIALV